MADDLGPRFADAFVGNILAAGADKGYRSLDVFVTWFVAGTAAAIGLAAANLEKLGWLFTPSQLQHELPSLGLILVLVLLSKLFGSIICTIAGAMEAAVGVMRRYDELKIPALEIDAFEAALRRARPWPARVAVWAWRKVAGGRGPNMGRLVTWLLLGSGICAFAAACFTVMLWISLLSVY